MYVVTAIPLKELGPRQMTAVLPLSADKQISNKSFRLIVLFYELLYFQVKPDEDYQYKNSVD